MVTAACAFAALVLPLYSASTNGVIQSSQTNAQELAVARQALRDGLWQVARAHASKLAGDAARLIVLESLANENRWDDIKAELAKIAHPETNPAFGYYIAVTTGKIAEAISFLRAGGSEAGLAEAKMLEADLHLRSTHTNDARRLWTEVVAMTNAGERALALASVNLNDVAAMRKAYARTVSVPLKRMVGLRLGRALVDVPESRAEGSRLIRAIVSDSPDAEGACDAFVSMAIAELSEGKWKETLKTVSEAMEIWPDAAKRADVQACRGEALFKTGRFEDSRLAYRRAEEFAQDDAMRARAALRQGDALAELGRGEESMERYRLVLEKFPTTKTAIELKRLIRLRERESEGRSLYLSYRFEDAMKAFDEVAKEDPGRQSRMKYLQLLCLYGLGRDKEALAEASALAADGVDPVVRTEAALWLAKFTYNRGEWREAVGRFVAFAEMSPDDPFAPDAFLWAARAAFAANDVVLAVKTVTRLVERYPRSKAATTALLVQAEALIELARFDEAVLVLDRMGRGEEISREDVMKSRLLKADALFAMGADNSVRYKAALEVYRSLADDQGLDASTELVVAFKIGRTLEKLKRTDEATDQYYSRVVLAYRDARLRGTVYTTEGQATFTRAAFRLADDFEARGRDYQAMGVLKLVAESDVPAATEAEARIQRISKKGRFL